jgi:GT2 family glycosyltransferase
MIKSEAQCAFETIVVDNASTDGSAEMVENQFPNVRLLKLNSNQGISGFNRGFEIASGDWILVLDDDSHPSEDCITRFMTIYKNLPDDVGGVACRTIYPLNGNLDSTANWTPEMISFWGCGAFLRKRVIDKIGGYLEDLFLYQNEIEWTIRARCYGYRVIFEPDLIVYHRSSPIGRTTNRAFRYNYKNRLILAWLYYPPLMLADYLFLALLIIFLKSLFRYKIVDGVFIIRSFISFCTRHSRLRLRREIIEWIKLPIWKDLELLPPSLADIPKRIIQGKIIY